MLIVLPMKHSWASNLSGFRARKITRKKLLRRATTSRDCEIFFRFLCHKFTIIIIYCDLIFIANWSGISFWVASGALLHHRWCFLHFLKAIFSLLFSGWSQSERWMNKKNQWIDGAELWLPEPLFVHFLIAGWWGATVLLKKLVKRFYDDQLSKQFDNAPQLAPRIELQGFFSFLIIRASSVLVYQKTFIHRSQIDYTPNRGKIKIQGFFLILGRLINDSSHVTKIKTSQTEFVVVWYSRTKRLLIKVAGTQKTITSTSAMARLAINRLVTVRIRGTRNTTEMTNRLPTRPTLNTSV